MYKVVNTLTKSEVFFNPNGRPMFPSLYIQVKEYVKRNKGKFPMKVYYKDYTTEVNHGWKLIETH